MKRTCLPGPPSLVIALAASCPCLLACRPEPRRAETASAALAPTAAAYEPPPLLLATSEPELNTVPEGACARAGRPPGVPYVSPLDDSGAIGPLVDYQLQKLVRADVDVCLAAAQKRTPGLQGRLVMSLDYAPQGRIARALVVAGAGDAALHRCVTDAFTSAPMPPFGLLKSMGFVVVLCPDASSAWPRDGYQRWW